MGHPPLPENRLSCWWLVTHPLLVEGDSITCLPLEALPSIFTVVEQPFGLHKLCCVQDMTAMFARPVEDVENLFIIPCSIN